MNGTFRTAWLSDVVDIIDKPETNRIVCHGKEFALVKHGHNTGEGVRWFKCSVCGWGFNDIFMTDESNIDTFPNYCPNCGAKMDEVIDGKTD